MPNCKGGGEEGGGSKKMQQAGSYQDFLKWGRGVLFTISLLCGIAVPKLQRWCGVNTCLTTVLVENIFFLKLVHWWRF